MRAFINPVKTEFVEKLAMCVTKTLGPNSYPVYLPATSLNT